jgi:hypothetical protein
MRKHVVLRNWLLAESLLLLCGHALAQTAATPEPSAAASATAPATSAATPPQAAAPAVGAAPEASAATPAAAGPAESTPAGAPPPAEAPAAVPSYFRIDHDYAFGLQLWAGATYPLAENIGLASDIYIAENYPVGGVGADGAPYLAQSWWGEFDLGPAFTFGPLSVTPMVGIAFDWAAKHAVAINGPQLYTILNTDKLYFESWVWTLLYSPFKDQVTANYFHTRDWVLYKLSGTVALGPQIELWTKLQDKASAVGFAPGKGISSLPIGGHIDLAYGTGNTLGLFVGYETHKDAREAVGGKGAVGRLTFVHNF